MGIAGTGGAEMVDAGAAAVAPISTPAWYPQYAQNRAPTIAGQGLPQLGQKANWGCGAAPDVMDIEDLLRHG
jgi:hypothetical protein